jgi:hypothetical protein
MSPISRIAPKKAESDDHPTFTEITLDVRPEEPVSMAGGLRRS